jgi:membrane protein YdbS with pleckstrin-like domain
LATLEAGFLEPARDAARLGAQAGRTVFGIGGPVAVRPRNWLYRAASFCAFLGAVCFGFYGVFVLASADWKHGSAMGNLLVAGLGVLLLFLAPILFTFGVIAWQTSRSL